MSGEDIFIVVNEADRATLLHALPKIFFPWEKLRSDLQAAGKAGFTVEYADLTSFAPPVGNQNRAHYVEDNHGNGGYILFADHVPGIPGEKARAAWGLFWFDGRIQIEQTLRGQQDNIDFVLSAEIAHAVDLFYFNSRGKRPALNALVHGGNSDAHPWFGGDYWQQVGEG